MQMNNKKKRILVIYTGGTIGMRPSAKGLVPEKGYLTDKLNEILKYELSNEGMPDVDVVEYNPLIDSADMDIEKINKLAQDIDQYREQYDGFVVLHGTDTMAYTSAALSFMLINLDKPVIVTGSQLPFAQFRSDGKNNIFNALYIISHFHINEVCLFFNDKLMRGNRVTKYSTDGFDAFKSLNAESIVDVGVQIKMNPNYKPLDVTFPFKLRKLDAQCIEFLFIYPGMDYAAIERYLELQPKVLVIMAYGIGNVPTVPAFQDRVKALIDAGILVICCSQCAKGDMAMESYEGGFVLQQHGALQSYSMSKEAIVTKLQLVLSNPTCFPDLVEAWKRPIAREF